MSGCDGFPDDWIGVRTEAEFPVVPGSAITVSCEDGYINTGSKVVTCYVGNLEYETKPACKRPGNYYNRIEIYHHTPSYIQAPVNLDFHYS